MAHSLNLTLKLRQDQEAQKKLDEFGKIFPQVQARIAAVMKESKILHFARVVLIGKEYIQVLTEYDGDRNEYALFFLRKLPDVFKLVFELAENAPPWEDLQDPDTFVAFSRAHDIQPLGASLTNDARDGFVFSAYGDKTVAEILAALAKTETA